MQQQTQSGLCGISLRQVLPESRIFGGSSGDVRVTSCCAESGSVKPGDLFAALPGAEVDGHDGAFEAVQRGAAAVLAERPLPIDVPTLMVENVPEAFGRVCQALAGNPSRRLSVVGVTGTNGKTTTSMLIGSILKAAGVQVGVMGTLGYCDTEQIAPSRETTPPATELARWLARMEAAGCTHAVVEVSSRALAEYRTAGIELDTAVVTNVRRDHLDLHGSVWNYRKIKARILSHLRDEGVAIFNADDPASKGLLAKVRNPALTVAMRSGAELTATIVERHRSEQTFLLSAGSETIPVRTEMIGDHHVANCLLAAAIGLVYGIELPTVAAGLEATGQVPGRLERIECGQPFSAFVDYARTPDALAAGLKAIKQVTEGRVFCVFGAKSDRNTESRPLLGRIVERGADVGVITSDNPRNESPLAVAHDILDGCDHPGQFHVIPDRARAIDWVLDEAGRGDSVLIAGKGDEDHQIVGDTWHHFDDRQRVRQRLYEIATDNKFPTGV